MGYINSCREAKEAGYSCKEAEEASFNDKERVYPCVRYHCAAYYWHGNQGCPHFKWQT